MLYILENFSAALFKCLMCMTHGTFKNKEFSISALYNLIGCFFLGGGYGMLHYQQYLCDPYCILI